MQLSALTETLDAGYRIPIRMWVAALTRAGRAIPYLVSGKGSRQNVTISCAKRAYRRRLGNKPQHASAAVLADAFPREWETFTKFCVVRNPFTLAVSDYNWRTRNLQNRPRFVDYLKALRAGDRLGGVVPVGFHNNWYQYTIGGRLAVDEVIRFENLTGDLGRVLASVGVPFSGELPKLKDIKAKSEMRLSYWEYYTPEAVDLVTDLYREEIDAFGYRLEDIQ